MLDREDWHAEIHGVAKSWTQLSNNKNNKSEVSRSSESESEKLAMAGA